MPTLLEQPVAASAAWVEYFRDNAAKPWAIDWERGAEITTAELAAIGKSLQAWQLGETSEGGHLARSRLDMPSESATRSSRRRSSFSSARNSGMARCWADSSIWPASAACGRIGAIISFAVPGIF